MNSGDIFANMSDARKESTNKLITNILQINLMQDD